MLAWSKVAVMGIEKSWQGSFWLGPKSQKRRLGWRYRFGGSCHVNELRVAEVTESGSSQLRGEIWPRHLGKLWAGSSP